MSNDELLNDRSITESVDPSTPETVDDPERGFDSDRPLPLNVLTQKKNARQLLDFFLSAEIPEEGLNKTEISEQSGVSTNGIRRNIDVLIEFGIVKMTTNEDVRFKRYATGEESPAVQELRRCNNTLADVYEPRD